jgi:poly(A) polymerase
LRAIRFAAKLNFTLHKDSETPIFELNNWVKRVPSARLFDEYLKLFLSGHAVQSFRLLRHYGLLEEMFPQSERSLRGKYQKEAEAFLHRALVNTDARIAEDKSVAPSFLLAVLLWYPFFENLESHGARGLPDFLASLEATSDILHEQQQSVAIPRRLTQIVREIWILQIRLAKQNGRRAQQLFQHPRFRAAYDFLLLRAESGDQSVQTLATWWTNYSTADEGERNAMIQASGQGPKRKRRFRRSSPRQQTVTKG